MLSIRKRQPPSRDAIPRICAVRPDATVERSRDRADFNAEIDRQRRWRIRSTRAASVLLFIASREPLSGERKRKDDSNSACDLRRSFFASFVASCAGKTCGAADTGGGRRARGRPAKNLPATQASARVAALAGTLRINRSIGFQERTVDPSFPADDERSAEGGKARTTSVMRSGVIPRLIDPIPRNARREKKKKVEEGFRREPIGRAKELRWKLDADLGRQRGHPRDQTRRSGREYRTNTVRPCIGTERRPCPGSGRGKRMESSRVLRRIAVRERTDG
ncbi:hypothetical protein KM043_000438 [Ampulex compressa]|nr:hypothetical protein KM043_000438 [Ampulex compressa]